MRWLNGINDSMDTIEQTPRDSKALRSLACSKPDLLQSTGSQRVRHNLKTEQQQPTPVFLLGKF